MRKAYNMLLGGGGHGDVEDNTSLGTSSSLRTKNSIRGKLVISVAEIRNLSDGIIESSGSEVNGIDNVGLFGGAGGGGRGGGSVFLPPKFGAQSGGALLNVGKSTPPPRSGLVGGDELEDSSTYDGHCRVYLNLCGQTLSTRSSRRFSKDGYCRRGTFMFANELMIFIVSPNDVVMGQSLSVEVNSGADMLGTRKSLGRILIPLRDMIDRDGRGSSSSSRNGGGDGGSDSAPEVVDRQWFYLNGTRSGRGEICFSWEYHSNVLASDNEGGDNRERRVAHRPPSPSTSSSPDSTATPPPPPPSRVDGADDDLLWNNVGDISAIGPPTDSDDTTLTPHPDLSSSGVDDDDNDAGGGDDDGSPRDRSVTVVERNPPTIASVPLIDDATTLSSPLPPSEESTRYRRTNSLHFVDLFLEGGCSSSAEEEEEEEEEEEGAEVGEECHTSSMNSPTSEVGKHKNVLLSPLCMEERSGSQHQFASKPSPRRSKIGKYKRMSLLQSAVVKSALRRSRAVSNKVAVQRSKPRATSCDILGILESKLAEENEVVGNEPVIPVRLRRDIERHSRCCERRARNIWRNDFHLQKVVRIFERGGTTSDARFAALAKDRRAMDVIRERAWDGIPMELRCKVWPLLTSGFERARPALEAVIGSKRRSLFPCTLRMLEQSPGILKECADAAASIALPHDVSKDLEKDINRTFTKHRTVVNMTERGKVTLRLVLRSHAAFHEAVGYAQSLNRHAALLLSLPGIKISHAFWLLFQLTGRVAASYYTPSMAGFLLDSSVLERILAARFPRLLCAMQKLGVPVMMAANRCLLVGFVLLLPTRSLLRLFDVSWTTGSAVWIATLLTVIVRREKHLAMAKSAGQFLVELNRGFLMCADSDAFMAAVRANYETLRASIWRYRLILRGDAEKEACASLCSRVARRLRAKTFDLIPTPVLVHLAARFVRVALAESRFKASDELSEGCELDVVESLNIVTAEGLYISGRDSLRRACGALCAWLGEIGTNVPSLEVTSLESVERCVMLLRNARTVVRRKCKTVALGSGSLATRQSGREGGWRRNLTGCNLVSIDIFVVACVFALNLKHAGDLKTPKVAAVRRFKSTVSPPALIVRGDEEERCADCKKDASRDRRARRCLSCSRLYCHECKGMVMLRVGRKRWRHRQCTHTYDGVTGSKGDRRGSSSSSISPSSRLRFPLDRYVLARLAWNVLSNDDGSLDLLRTSNFGAAVGPIRRKWLCDRRRARMRNINVVPSDDAQKKNEKDNEAEWSDDDWNESGGGIDRYPEDDVELTSFEAFHKAVLAPNGVSATSPHAWFEALVCGTSSFVAQRGDAVVTPLSVTEEIVDSSIGIHLSDSVVLPAWFPLDKSSSSMTMTRPLDSTTSSRTSIVDLAVEGNGTPVTALSPGTQIVQSYKVSSNAIRAEPVESVVTCALLDAETRLPSAQLAVNAHYSLTFSRRVAIRRLHFTTLASSENGGLLRSFDLQYKDNGCWHRCKRVSDVSSKSVAATSSLGGSTLLASCIVDIPPTDGASCWRLTHLKTDATTDDDAIRMYNVRVSVYEEECVGGGGDEGDSVVSSGSIVMAGWLRKRGQGFLRNWTRRYVTLRSGGTLEYRKRPDATDARKTVVLDLRTVVESYAMDKHVFAFRILTKEDEASSEQLCLAANSASDRDRWIVMLRRVADSVASLSCKGGRKEQQQQHFTAVGSGGDDDGVGDAKTATLRSSANSSSSSSLAWTVFASDPPEWKTSSTSRVVRDEMPTLRSFYCALERNNQKLKFYRSKSERHSIATRTLRDVRVITEPQPRLILLSSRRGRRFYTALLERNDGQWIRLFFLSTQQRAHLCGSLRAATDRGCHGYVWVQRLPGGSRDMGTAPWKRRYVELRDEAESMSLFRAPSDKVEASRLALRGYVVRPVRLGSKQQKRIVELQKISGASSTSLGYRRGTGGGLSRKWVSVSWRLHVLQLWHPKRDMINLCTSDESLYLRLRNALVSVCGGCS